MKLDYQHPEEGKPTRRKLSEASAFIAAVCTLPVLLVCYSAWDPPPVTSVDPHKLLLTFMFFPVCVLTLVGTSLAIGDALSGRGCTRTTVIGIAYNSILLIGMILLGLSSHMKLL